MDITTVIRGEELEQLDYALENYELPTPPEVDEMDNLISFTLTAVTNDGYRTMHGYLFIFHEVEMPELSGKFTEAMRKQLTCYYLFADFEAPNESFMRITGPVPAVETTSSSEISVE